MDNIKDYARYVYRNFGQANANTFLFCKEIISIVLVFTVCAGAATATLRMQQMGTFQFMPLIKSAAIGGGVTFLLVITIVWVWNCLVAPFAAWREQRKK